MQQCTPQRFKHEWESNHSACLPEARVHWAPERWQSHHHKDAKPTLPRGITSRHVERACDGIRLHIARPSPKLNISWWSTRAHTVFFNKYAPPSFTSSRERVDEARAAARRARKAECVAQLRSFRPMVCSLKDVLVWGHARRLMSANGSAYFLPPEVVDQQRAHDGACPANCQARPSSVVACGGHALLGRNLMGVAYYHTLYETLGSVAFALDLLTRHGPAGMPRVRL